MALEKDAANDGKKTVFLIAVCIGIAGAGAFLGWGWLHRAAPSPSSYNIDRVAGNGGVATPETAHYRQQMHAADRSQARQASQDGDSFIASVSEAPIAVPDTRADLEPVSLNTSPVTEVVPASGVGDDQKEALKGYLKTLNSRWRPAGVQLADTFGQTQGNTGTGGSQGDDAFSHWIQSLPGNAPVERVSITQTGTTAPVPPQVVVAPGTRQGGVIDNAVDSDNQGAIVLAHIPAGPLAGARFTARGVQLAGDGVVIHFTRMTLGGSDYDVDAYALQDDTLQSSVASNVNHRYFSRILLPAIAQGIGGVGQLYKDQNTQILSTNAGTISGGTGSVKGSAVAGTIVGGIGSAAGQVMAGDAARLPARQVQVYQNQVVAILFMKGVYDSDRVKKDLPATATSPGAQ